tara:strand:+ start:94 stop:546 length:453 start_codon:yes stop_codon:yes gene_type:complete
MIRTILDKIAMFFFMGMFPGLFIFIISLFIDIKFLQGLSVAIMGISVFSMTFFFIISLFLSFLESSFSYSKSLLTYKVNTLQKIFVMIMVASAIAFLIGAQNSQAYGFDLWDMEGMFESQSNSRKTNWLTTISAMTLGISITGYFLYKEK